MNTDKNISRARDVIQIDKELLENVSHFVEEQESGTILNILADLHPADIAEIINHLDYDDAEYVFHLLDNDTAAEVIVELDEDLREKILRDIDTEKITDIVDELDTDDATDIVSDLPEKVADEVLKNIDMEDSEDVKELLKYPEDTAGGIMSSDFVWVRDNVTIRAAIREVRNNKDEFEQIYHIYVLDESDRLVGFVPIKELLVNPLKTPIVEVMDEDLIYVTPEVDQEEVANIMEKYDLVALPVVDENKVMLGRITIDDIVDVIQEEAEEDLQKMAGLTDDEEYSHSTLRVSGIRLPWLMVSLMGELLSAVVLSSFEASIEKLIVASFFIPVVMAMGGSSGSQAAIVMVRSLSNDELWFSKAFKRLWKEFRVAIINSIACSAVLLAATYFFFHSELFFSSILALSLMIIMINATMIGAVVPVFLRKLNIDPAIATGPFVTTMNDVLGLLIYLSLVTIFFIV